MREASHHLRRSTRLRPVSSASCRYTQMISVQNTEWRQLVCRILVIYWCTMNHFKFSNLKVFLDGSVCWLSLSWAVLAWDSHVVTMKWELRLESSKDSTAGDQDAILPSCGCGPKKTTSCMPTRSSNPTLSLLLSEAHGLQVSEVNTKQF